MSVCIYHQLQNTPGTPAFILGDINRAQINVQNLNVLTQPHLFVFARLSTVTVKWADLNLIFAHFKKHKIHFCSSDGRKEQENTQTQMR